jgi:hypothetical protein
MLLNAERHDDGPVAELADGRHLRSLTDYLRRSPELRERYAKLRRHSANIIGSNYDISAECNLRCEGCLFFEGTDGRDHGDSRSEHDWEAFFAAERQRGVNFPYLAGAEPALQPHRLQQAARYFQRGVVFTNGTTAIDPDLPFTIHVSIWGTKEDTVALRGGNSFGRALRNFASDPRARFVYTVNARNLQGAREVAQICADQGAKLSFSIFSPTSLYRWKLEHATENDADYFRSSSKTDHLAPSPEMLLRIRETLDEISETLPETVIYSRAYNRWVTDPAGLYDIDPVTGWARDCETRRTQHHKHFRTDLTSSESKCCSPNLECRDCRAYAMASGTAVSRFRRFLSSYEGFCDWVSIAEQWSRLFMHDWDTRTALKRAPATRSEP